MTTSFSCPPGRAGDRVQGRRPLKDGDGLVLSTLVIHYVYDRIVQRAKEDVHRAAHGDQELLEAMAAGEPPSTPSCRSLWASAAHGSSPEPKAGT
ncbi:hypothetical protein ABZ858_29670 [Streptomyces sp. NPDC047017]|uniref:hypothetical protein n=1 Tax=Streptomyces sp. NPDC047017 TaxID=3155024 RepID=UPI00340E9A70